MTRRTECALAYVRLSTSAICLRKAFQSCRHRCNAVRASSATQYAVLIACTCALIWRGFKVTTSHRGTLVAFSVLSDLRRSTPNTRLIASACWGPVQSVRLISCTFFDKALCRAEEISSACRTCDRPASKSQGTEYERAMYTVGSRKTRNTADTGIRSPKPRPCNTPTAEIPERR